MLSTFPQIVAHEPVLVFGGPYSNLEATQALFAQAARLGIPADRMICTGDVVAYGADAAATAHFIRASGCHVVMGNCEESLAQGDADCGCGFLPGSACDHLSSAWFAHAQREIDADLRAWMAQLPRRIILTIGDKRLAIVHGSAERINRFVFASTSSVTKVEDIDATGCDGIISGHSGLPFTQFIDGRLWHNAGAIGLPANDGTPRGWFSLLAPDDDGLRISHHAFTYDHAAAATKMRVARLPDGYADALTNGIWPSCDILPFDEIRSRGIAYEEGAVLWQETQSDHRSARRAQQITAWPTTARNNQPALAPEKFKDPLLTAKGETRAQVTLVDLQTLWFNTGTLCNITCRNCYIESSPTNDALVYLSRAEVAAILDDIPREGFATDEIGFTGGEPFMNRDIIGMIEDSLTRGYRVLVLTNAMRPMQRFKKQLLALMARLRNAGIADRLTMRVSLDHFNPDRHEDERGPGTYAPTLNGMIWLARNGFRVHVAGRTMWGDDLVSERAGYKALFDAHDLPIDANDPAQLVLFPEMDASIDVPEITEACWGILHKSPSDTMCAHSRMVIKRKGAARPRFVACTLLPYDEQFEMGETLQAARKPVSLNHPHCAKFCVLGGASCSAA